MGNSPYNASNQIVNCMGSHGHEKVRGYDRCITISKPNKRGPAVNQHAPTDTLKIKYQT